MKLLQELGNGKASAVMLGGRAGGGLAASVVCGAATDAVTGDGVVSPSRRRLARKTSVEGAESPARRRLVRKTSVEEMQVLSSASPVLRKATTPERAAKARRLGEAAL